MTPVQILETSLSSLSGLFAQHEGLVAIRQSVLEGRLGRAWGDAEIAANVARLDLGCYSVFAGDSHHPSARGLVEAVTAPRELVYPDSSWRARILEVFGTRVTDRPMTCYSGEFLDTYRLRSEWAHAEATHELRPLDAEALVYLDQDLEPHALQTHSPESFLASAMGWGVFWKGSALEPLSVATSYAVSRDWVEVAVATRPEHRRHGHAAAVAARFCLEATGRGLTPCWSAANPISKRLAVKLGFVPSHECEVLFLAGRR